MGAHARPAHAFREPVSASIINNLARKTNAAAAEKVTHVWQQQIEQTPQLLELVLQGSARQQQTARCHKAVQVLAQLALPV